MSIITKKSLVAAGILTALIAGNAAMAADVPAGVQLAEKQTLVRNNGPTVRRLPPKISSIAGSVWRIQIPPPRMRVTSSMAILPISMTSSRAKSQ